MDKEMYFNFLIRTRFICIFKCLYDCMSNLFALRDCGKSVVIWVPAENGHDSENSPPQMSAQPDMWLMG